MESELIPGYDFEYTLDGVLKPEYDEQLHKKYRVNGSYILNHENELLNLPDACIPLLGYNRKKRDERFMRDLDVDGNGTLGLYQWVNLFGKMYEYNIEDILEDDIRMALDLVKKYPEHKDLVKLREDYEIKEDAEE